MSQIAKPTPVYTSSLAARNAVLNEAAVKKIMDAMPKYHWRRDPPDSRDRIYQPVAIRSTKPVPWSQITESVQLPSRVDLRPYASPIDDQGNLGSCTGNAIAGAIDLIDKKQNRTTRVSRLFIYYQERVLEGDVNQDNGAYIRDGIKACYTWGAPQESLWPYTISKFASRPTAAVYSDAANRKVTSYQRCTDFTAVKNALMAGSPVVVGFDVYSSFESGTWWQPHGTGLMPYPAAHEQLLGGHAVCLVGFDDNMVGPDSHGYFIVRNSWGTGWAQQGYFYMPYRVIQNTAMSSDFWTITVVHNP